MYSVLSELTCRPMPATARSRLCSRDSAWESVFAKNAVIGVVPVRNCLCRASSDSFLCQLETVIFYSYLPTLPLEQDMTQGQFLSGV